MSSSSDLILVGTGFASTFFLKRWLASAPPGARVRVLERGQLDPHAWQVANRRNSSFEGEAHVERGGHKKEWVYVIGFGGGSNRWWACTPRMLPSDFRTQTMYGIGRDWPVDYDELEPFYAQVEDAMSVAGPSDDTPFRRSTPYPQPPHLATEPERLLAEALPGKFFRQPCARTRRATKKRRVCCASGVCSICPIDVKFSVQNELADVYEDERVELTFGAMVTGVVREAGEVVGVSYEEGGREQEARGDLVVLGANAIFNAHILLRSGFEHPMLGKRLVEQVGRNVVVYLDGVDNFQGSTSVTGHGYMLYDGEHRRERAAALIETFNIPDLRRDHGRWRQKLHLKFIYEDLPSEESTVSVDRADPNVAVTRFGGHSEYTQRGLDALEAQLPDVLAPLPVESIEVRSLNKTEAHILGTTVFGDDPATSVLDRNLIHHEQRNLVVLGSGCFPGAPPANPTLTLSALALRAAEHLAS